MTSIERSSLPSDATDGPVIHLIANAHIDPVWLWDSREGLNAGLCTVRTVLDLMDECRELTFVRGEAAIYEHVARYDPASFERIRAMVRAGRWDVVGGTYVQPDNNLPATETLCRQFARGQQYFARTFGKRVRVAWAADSFGHAAGLPDIFAAAGIESFAFTRPSENTVPLRSPAFWWEGAGGSKILCYRPLQGGYQCERHDVASQLDAAVRNLHDGGLQNVACFFGLGNHGGGPTRRHLHDIRQWTARHPDVRVVYSGLHRLFECIRTELHTRNDLYLPVHRTELNYVFRGCYSSMARVKFAYRRTESLVRRAERVVAACSSVLKDLAPLPSAAWDSLLFNSFHDILPGSSIERASDEQIESLGHANSISRATEFDAINRLSAAIDAGPPASTVGDLPSPVAVLVFNPSPRAFDGPVEAEVCLDDRPLVDFHGQPERVPVAITDADNKCIRHQRIASEHRAFLDQPWRLRSVFPVKLAPFGWQVLNIGLDHHPDPDRPTSGQAVFATQDTIKNQFFSVRALVGATGVSITRNGSPFLSEDGLGAVVIDDNFGSWGNMSEQSNASDFSVVREKWHVAEVRMVEHGPVRVAMWVRLAGPTGHSHLDLLFQLTSGRDVIDVSARLNWNERGAMLKLVIPAGATEVVCDVPGATVVRGEVGEMPGGRWSIARSTSSGVGFVSDSLYGSDLHAGALRPTVVRSAPFASSHPWDATLDPSVPVFDTGEHRFRFVLCTANEDRVRQLTETLEFAPIVQIVLPGAGRLARQGGFLSVEPPSLDTLAVKTPEHGDGIVVRLRNVSSQDVDGSLRVCGEHCKLGLVPVGAIATFRVRRTSEQWVVSAEGLEEETSKNGE